MAREIIPSQAVKSKYNERQGEVDKESEEFQNLVSTIEEAGLAQNPKATMEEGNVAIIDGWHRVKAAEEAKLDKIEVSMDEEIDSLTALKTSLNGNLEEARTRVGPRERALQLNRIWEESGGEGLPSPTQLSEEIGVGKSTVSKWLEPLRGEWEDTAFDPTKESLQEFTPEEVSELGVRKLRSIRKTTGGGEEGEWLARQTLDNGFTIQDLAQIRRNAEEGRSVENAVGVFTGELSEEEVETDPEPMEEEESEEEEETSTAELGQHISAYADDSTESETSSPETPESTDSPSIEEDDEEEEEEFTYNGRTPDELVASEEAIKEMQRNSDSWTDDLEPVEEEEEEYPDVAEFPAFTIEGDVAVGAYQAAEDIGAEGDMEELARCAIDWFVREAEYV